MASDLGPPVIERALRSSWGRPLRFYASIGSTNIEALEWARRGAPRGSLVVADHQTAGRGRWGRSWLSEGGKALQLSVVLGPEPEPERLGLVTTLGGLACAEAIAEETPLEPAIEWPNDVIVSGRKLAGVLVETRVSSNRVEAAVCGIGVNVGWLPGEFPEELGGRVTSIAAELARGGLGPPPERAELLGALLERLESGFSRLGRESGRRALVARAAERSSVLGREVELRLASGALVEGRAAGLTPTGALEVETAARAVVVDAGEIERLRT